MNFEVDGFGLEADGVVTIKRHSQTIFVVPHADDPACAGWGADLARLNDESLSELVHGLPIGQLAVTPYEKLLAIGGGGRPGADEARIDRVGEAGACQGRGREAGDKTKNDWPNLQRMLRHTARP